jgi:hypothetical protein
MNALCVEVVDAKTVRLIGIFPIMADCLQRLGEILAQRDTPEVRQRLIPTPSTDDSINAEWERFITPDLRHLFVSAGETVLQDLTQLQADPHDPKCFSVAFPVVHLDAWMSAINQSRLILAEQHHITEEDMNRDGLDLRSASDIPLIRINLLGWLLSVLVQFGDGKTRE